ncbi:MAG: UxaA family hydrolase, partial [Roseibium sp.]|nr:UxaA family hydrolase [Roseibium sp.]
MTGHPRLIQIHSADNVAVVANDGGLAAGTEVDGLTLTEDVPQAHKVALVALDVGTPILRYGVVIGHAVQPLKAGAWVNETNLKMPSPPVLSDQIMPKSVPPDMEPLEGYSFQGFRNLDGSVGTRNILAITNTVQCVSGVVSHAVDRIRREVLPRFPNVDDVVALDHTYGCGVAIEAPGADIPIRTLRNIARNPNFAGSTMVVSLGCEKLQPSRLFPDLFDGKAIPGQNLDTDLVTLQDESHLGFETMITSILQSAEQHLTELNMRKRETCPVSERVVGMHCGGSDALSGVTANPALGVAADLIVRAGGTVLFSEVTEVRDGIDRLVARAETPEVARDLIKEMAWYDGYLSAGLSDRSANTTPGNKKGGLSNIVEKAMGSISKSGSMQISGVVPAGERAK